MKWRMEPKKEKREKEDNEHSAVIFNGGDYKTRERD